MSEVAGLRGFLERANLSGYFAQAKEFCNSCGAIEIQEVLEDAEVCNELVTHLQLKMLERRRFEMLAEAVRSDPTLALDVAEATPLSRTTSGPSPGGHNPSAQRLDRTTSCPFAGVGESHSRQRQAFSNAGWSKGRHAATPAVSRGTRSVGYFSTEDTDERSGGNARAANHYFSTAKEEDAGEPARSGGSCYFESPSTQTVGEERSQHQIQEVLQRFQPFFDSIEVITSAQKARAAEFLDEHGATSMEDILLCSLAEKFTAFLELKPVPQAKAQKFWRELAGRQPGGGSHGVSAPSTATPAGSAAEPRGGCGAAAAAAGSRRGAAERYSRSHSSSHYFVAAEEEEEEEVGGSEGAPAGALPMASKGVGAYIRSVEGELWGRCVGDGGRVWQLASGRSARKDTQGVKWNWDEAGPRAGPRAAAEAAKAPQPRAAAVAAVQQQQQQPQHHHRSDGGPKTSVLDSLAERKRQDEEALAAKREAARMKRRQQEEHPQPQYRGAQHTAVPQRTVAPPAELRRIDPDDRRSYTYEELRRKYELDFSNEEILEYWKFECKQVL